MTSWLKRTWWRLYDYFASISAPLLIKSIKEVFWLSIIAFLPLMASIVIHSISVKSLALGLRHNVVPGEIVAFSLSFIAPTLYLFIKTHGNNYKLPMLEFISIITMLIYMITAILYVIAKNGWVSDIDMNSTHGNVLYLRLSLGFLVATFLIWIYSTYHSESYSDFGHSLRKGSQRFATQFKNTIAKRKGS